MDHPLLPALMIFGPFFLLMMMGAFGRRRADAPQVKAWQRYLAVLTTLLIAAGGLLIAYLWRT